jgi:hypothetical protein
MNEFLIIFMAITIALAPSIYTDIGRQEGMKTGMIECKLKPKECDKQFEIYQKEQEIKNLQQSIKN